MPMLLSCLPHSIRDLSFAETQQHGYTIGLQGNQLITVGTLDSELTLPSTENDILKTTK